MPNISRGDNASPARPPRRADAPDLSPVARGPRDDWPAWADIAFEALELDRFDARGNPWPAWADVALAELDLDAFDDAGNPVALPLPVPHPITGGHPRAQERTQAPA